MAYVQLHGHIGREPEVKSLGDSLCCSFPLADRAWLKPTGEEREVQAQWYRVELEVWLDVQVACGLPQEPMKG